jgi:4-hydroxybenzoate polyprenyltransferase
VSTPGYIIIIIMLPNQSCYSRLCVGTTAAAAAAAAAAAMSNTPSPVTLLALSAAAVWFNFFCWLQGEA